MTDWDALRTLARVAGTGVIQDPADVPVVPLPCGLEAVAESGGIDLWADGRPVRFGLPTDLVVSLIEKLRKETR